MRDSIEVFIYIKSSEHSERVMSLLNNLGGVAGIVQAKLNPHIKQLLNIRYQPKQISSSSVNGLVQQQGFASTLVGM